MATTKQPGYAVRIRTGQHEGKFGVAYHREQTKEILALKKVLVHVFEDNTLSTPVLNEKGEPVKILKAVDAVKPYGYVD